MSIPGQRYLTGVHRIRAWRGHTGRCDWRAGDAAPLHSTGARILNHGWERGVAWPAGSRRNDARWEGCASGMPCAVAGLSEPLRKMVEGAE